VTDALKDLVGRKVEIWTNSGQSSYKDSGIVDRCDGVWLRLRTDKELKIFCAYTIRLIKCTEEGL
jgi:hypothetical protein